MKMSLKATIAISCLSIVLFLVLLSVGFSPIRASGTEKADSWQPLSELTDREQLSAIIADNTAPSADRTEIMQNATALQKGDILVIDFASASLCGRGGCAIAAYRVSTGEQLLFTYTARRSGSGLVELIEREGADLPCIVLSPFINSAARESITEVMCYRSGEWFTEDL